ncbi:MAG: HPr family phosphocarrier protein [Clostridiaceae bacterium]
MVSRDVTVKGSTGLHARPATLLVKKASSFKSDVLIEIDGKNANAKSLIGVLSLGVKSGSVVNITTSGVDEKYALEEILKLIESLNE